MMQNSTRFSSHVKSIPHTGTTDDGESLFKRYSTRKSQGFSIMTEHDLIAFINDHYTAERQNQLQRQAVEKLKSFDTDNNGIQLDEFLEFARMECARKWADS